MKKIYCVYCGTENENNVTVCKKCNKPLNPKENLWWDYIYDHIKDDLKDNVTDNVISLITNYVKSHLYGIIMTVLVVATAATGIATVVKNNNIPSYIEEVIVNNNVEKSTEIDFNGVFTTREGSLTKYFIFNDDGTGFQVVRPEDECYYTPLTWRKEGNSLYFKESYNIDAIENEISYVISGQDQFKELESNTLYKKVSFSDLPFSEKNGMYSITIWVPVEVKNIREDYHIEGTVNNEKSSAITVQSADRQTILDNLNSFKIVVDCSTFDYDLDDQIDNTQDLKYTVILPEGVTHIPNTDHIALNLDKNQ